MASIHYINKSWVRKLVLFACFVLTHTFGLPAPMLIAKESSVESVPQKANDGGGEEPVLQRTPKVIEGGGEETPSLPSIKQLMDAKLSALKSRLNEQEVLLTEAQLALAKEKGLEAQTFDDVAYLSLSIFNSAPPKDYRLVRTDVFLNGKQIARGGKRNQGLPRNNEQIFFGPVAPGCHDVMVRAEYVRIKNNIISRFLGIDRIEKLERNQAFIAKNGYRVEMEIEGFEAQNTFVKLYRGPELRFNRSVRPNFLSNASLLSMDEVLKQGRVRIDYLSEGKDSRLIEKSLSIDGLPILTKEKHEGPSNVVFDAPLAEGKHTLNVTLLFGEKQNIGGGPRYNFRLNFDRVFYVMSGQSTVINLVGLPKDGFRSTPEQSRYARVSSKILSEESSAFFPTERCEVVRKRESEVKKAAEPKTPLKPLAPALPVGKSGE